MPDGLPTEELTGEVDGIGAFGEPVSDGGSEPVAELSSSGFPLVPQQQRQFIGPHEHQSDLLGTSLSHHRGRVKSSAGSRAY